jgi:hypothetical protein
MISFICFSASCLQMYLGSGYIITQTPDRLIYYNFQKTYICNKSDQTYSCTDRNVLKDGASLH